MRRSKTNQLTLCALLIAVALVLSYMERFIPLQMLIPLPGIKLGLANIVTVMALYFFGKKQAFTILILRCVLGSVFGGGISGLAFSLTGGLMAMTLMSVTRRLGIFSVYGVSILGAAAHKHLHIYCLRRQHIHFQLHKSHLSIYYNIYSL